MSASLLSLTTVNNVPFTLLSPMNTKLLICSAILSPYLAFIMPLKSIIYKPSIYDALASLELPVIYFLVDCTSPSTTLLASIVLGVLSTVKLFNMFNIPISSKLRLTTILPSSLKLKLKPLTMLLASNKGFIIPLCILVCWFILIVFINNTS